MDYELFGEQGNKNYEAAFLDELGLIELTFDRIPERFKAYEPLSSQAEISAAQVVTFIKREIDSNNNEQKKIYYIHMSKNSGGFFTLRIIDLGYNEMVEIAIATIKGENKTPDNSPTCIFKRYTYLPEQTLPEFEFYTDLIDTSGSEVYFKQPRTATERDPFYYIENLITQSIAPLDFITIIPDKEIEAEFKPLAAFREIYDHQYRIEETKKNEVLQRVVSYMTLGRNIVRSLNARFTGNN